MTDTAQAGATRNGATERLVLSHFTLDRNHPIEDRFRAARAAGIDGVGIFAGQYAQLLAEDWSPARFHELIDDSGVRIVQVEALSGWGAHELASRYVDFEQIVWDMVDEFEVPYVQSIGPYDGTVDDAIERFGALCDRAAEHGTKVGLEFLPFTNIFDAADALAVVEGAARDNSGVCVDIWHHARGANDLDLIRSIPVELIAGVQMSDGPATPTVADYKDDCLRFRVPPGTGEFEVDAFVSALLDLGVDLPWDLEVCNESARGNASGPHVAACAAGMRTVLDRVFLNRHNDQS